MSHNWSDDLTPFDREDLMRLEQRYSLMPTLPSDDKQAVVDFVRSRLGPSDAQYPRVTPSASASSGELSAFDAALKSKRPFWGLISLAYGIPSDLEVSEQLQEVVQRFSLPRIARSVREGLKALESASGVSETENIISMLTSGVRRTVQFATYRHIRDGVETPSWDVTGSYFMSRQPGKECSRCTEDSDSAYHTHSITGFIDFDTLKTTLQRLATASRARRPAPIELDPVEPTEP